MILYTEFLLVILIFINLVLLSIVVIIGGAIMDTIKSNIALLQTAITALQGRIGSGVIVQQADIDSVNASLSTAITNLNVIAA